MSKVRQAKQLPATMRNPFIAGLMVEELRKHATNMEKEDQPNAKMVLMVRAFAKELEDFAEGKIGTHADNL